MIAITSRMGWMSAAAVATLGACLMFSPMAQVVAAPAGGQAKTEAPAVKLTKPWSEIQSLSAEQRTKIHDIHVKALAQVSQIQKQEKADILALLSDAQKTELKETMSGERKTAAQRKMDRRAGAPATAPAK